MSQPETSEDQQRPGRTQSGRGDHVDLGRVASITMVVLAILGVAWLLLELASFLLLIFAALVLAAVFDVITSAICRLTGLGRGLSLGIAVLALLAVLAGVFALFGTQLARELDTIRETIPPAVAQVEALLDRAGLGEQIEAALDQGNADVTKLATQAGGYALTATGWIANILLILIGAIFIAADPSIYRRGLLLMVPRRAEETLGTALDDAARGLRGWMLGQAASSGTVALFTGAGLTLLGVPAAAGLGLIAGLLDVIPMVGPIIAAIPAILLAFTVSPTTALWTILLFVLVQQLQSYVLLPMIQKHAVDIPPALLLFALVGFGLLFGFIGVLLAAPLTVVAFVMVRRIYVQTLLGKDIDLDQR